MRYVPRVPSQAGKDQELAEFAEPAEAPAEALPFREALRERLWQWLRGASAGDGDEPESRG